MISIVCVYNKRNILEDNLLKSLKNQTAKYQFIEIDNSLNIFNSATKALNYAGRKAIGKYIIFVHQDVELYGNYWLEDVEKLLDTIPDIGIAGCAGIAENGEKCGFIKDRTFIWGEPINKPCKVQTLDECILIIPQKVFNNFQFDERLTSWHMYGTDYSLTAIRKGLCVYVIPAFIIHNSLNQNRIGLKKAQRLIRKKHQAFFDQIYTTTGALHWPELYLPYQIYKRIWEKKRIPTESLKRDFLEKNTVNYDKIVYLSYQKKNELTQRCVPEIINSENFTNAKKSIVHYLISENNSNFNPTIINNYDCAIITLDAFENFIKIKLANMSDHIATKKLILLEPNGNYQNQNEKSLLDLQFLAKSGFKLYKNNKWAIIAERLD